MPFLPKALLWVPILFICNIGYSQLSHSAIKKELRQLEGSAYVSRAFEGAESFAQEGSFKQSLDLLNRGVKKARSMGENPSIVVKLNKAKIIKIYFPSDKKYVNEVISALEDITKYNPPIAVFREVEELAEQYNTKLNPSEKSNFQKFLTFLNQSIESKKEELLDEEKEDELKEFKKLKKVEAFEELEKLKDERERLEALQVRLSASVDRNEKLLSVRRSEINRMSKEQAKKEAIIQLNHRVIDSLEFTAELDSLKLISHQRLINEQQSEIALQTSELNLKDAEIALKSSRQKLFMTLSIFGLILAGFLSWMVYTNKKNYKLLKSKNETIEFERDRSEKLLLNILPKYIANELKESSVVKTRTINLCTVLFTDFINFSNIAKQLSPKDLIAALDECFRAFDQIVAKYNIEKIKTIGDAYMCAGGVPLKNETHAIDAVNAAQDMVAFLTTWNNKREEEGKIRFDARIGIHSGPIISGVVGQKKFAYDIWGDTVNIAARLESKSEAQRINISDATYELIKNHYECIKREKVPAKNMKDLQMYFVEHAI